MIPLLRRKWQPAPVFLPGEFHGLRSLAGYNPLLFSHSVMTLCNPKDPCPSLSPEACSISCPLSQWCHPTISSSVAPFSSCLRCFPASGAFSVSWLFISGGQCIGASVSASVLPMNIQGWFPLGMIGWISLQSKGTLKSLLQHHRLQDDDILEICWETMWICNTQTWLRWQIL